MFGNIFLFSDLDLFPNFTFHFKTTETAAEVEQGKVKSQRDAEVKEATVGFLFRFYSLNKLKCYEIDNSNLFFKNWLTLIKTRKVALVLYFL